MLLILALFSGVVGAVAMPTLAALLIYAAAGSLRFGQIATIWRTGLTSQIAIATTFVATLLLPVAAAVGLGVVLSLLLQLNQAALDLKVVELVPDADGRLEERPAPAAADQSHGHAHRRVRQPPLRRRPHPPAAPPRPDRDRSARPSCCACAAGSTLGATFFTVLASYAKQLDAVGGRLYVAGLDPALIAQARRTGTIPDDGPVKLYEADPVIGESSLAGLPRRPSLGDLDAPGAGRMTSHHASAGSPRLSAAPGSSRPRHHVDARRRPRSWRPEEFAELRERTPRRDSCPALVDSCGSTSAIHVI